MKRLRMSEDHHDISMIIAEHEREKAMNIDLTVKYDLAKRVYEAEFGDTDYTDAISVMAYGARHWLPTNEDGWMVLRAGFKKNKKKIPTIDLMEKAVSLDSPEALLYRALTDEVAAHFAEHLAAWEDNLDTYVEYYPMVYDKLRNIKTAEQLAEAFPEYADVLEFYITDERIIDEVTGEDKGPKEPREPRVIREPRERKEPREPREPKEPRDEPIEPTPDDPTPVEPVVVPDPDPKPPKPPKPPKEPKA